MRSNHDCILTSVRTIIEDDPILNCRINGLENRSPTRIILDKKLEIPKHSKIVQTSKKYKTIIFFNKIRDQKILYLKKCKINLVRFPLSKDENFNLKDVLLKIKKLGFSRIFLESGLKMTTHFLKNELIDDFKLFVSNKKIGKNGNNSFKENMKYLSKRKELLNENIYLYGDKLFSYRIK